MKAAIYCRVSTDSQAEQGSSLESQRVACLKKGAEYPGFEASNIFQESYTGAELDRPRLNELRELVRQKAVDAVICYSTDRLARNPIHIGIIAEECERRHIQLIFVTEPMDNSPEGALIRYVKGYAGGIEREKIRDRMLRGRRSRALQGKLPTGHARLYGYGYDKETGKRVIDEAEAQVVRQMFAWLVDERLSCNEICRRLMDNHIPSPEGLQRWGRSTVGRILSYDCYTGSSYAFKYKSVETLKPVKPYAYKLNHRIIRPEAEWLKLPDATPAIISQETFEAAQRQLAKNRLSGPKRNLFRYLLKSLVFCGRCGRRYSADSDYRRNGYRSYRCGSHGITGSYCHNKIWTAEKLENDVWERLKQVARNPQDLIGEIESRIKSGDQLRRLEVEIAKKSEQVLKINRQVEKTIRLYTAMEDADPRECAERIKKLKGGLIPLEEEIDQLQWQVRISQQMTVKKAEIEAFFRDSLINVENATFEQKRWLLEELDLRIIINGEEIELKGTIPGKVSLNVSTWGRNTGIPFDL